MCKVEARFCLNVRSTIETTLKDVFVFIVLRDTLAHKMHFYVESVPAFLCLSLCVRVRNSSKILLKNTFLQNIFAYKKYTF